eukprot:CAMPEP_0198332380 /NCGR_PEP_ID=MMETSP1450-20131203/18246_1 /TAXON_ID=753684 ORGANISM="Madagascaria erythrocladiodes, Strain CCMP3234" /NCGR_SAMPLE_ID=MMETSP1450 /ASSEMBLY_ACC=CAM_ASM_001115 /LENGTH=252 /DNA_ID=CAMNT_0044036829 /DNA_START=56 /DNA_END=814 /DNA_ORIENTATION=+
MLRILKRGTEMGGRRAAYSLARSLFPHHPGGFQYSSVRLMASSRSGPPSRPVEDEVEESEEVEDDNAEIERFRKTKTYGNLKKSLSASAVDTIRYEYFAQRADVAGDLEAASGFRELGRSAQQHALGHMEWLSEAGDPVTNQPIQSTQEFVESCEKAVSDVDTARLTDASEVADDEGFEDHAGWFRELTDAMSKHQSRLMDIASSADFTGEDYDPAQYGEDFDEDYANLDDMDDDDDDTDDKKPKKGKKNKK